MYIHFNFKYTFCVISKAFSEPNIESYLTSTKKLAKDLMSKVTLKTARFEL